MKFTYKVLPTLLLFGALILFFSGKEPGGRLSILDTLYAEAKEENADLRGILEQWEKTREESKIKRHEIQSVLSDCESYFIEAKALANTINVTKLKGNTQTLLVAAEAEYTQKADPLRKQMAQLDSMERLMGDYEAAFKISFTLPKVKTLQNNLNTDAKAALKGYEELISRSDKLLNSTRP